MDLRYFSRGTWLIIAFSLWNTFLVSRSSDAVELFNGKDLKGWVLMHEAKFEITNGVLCLVGGRGWLKTEKKYKDFELELEWRALEPRYDSGILIRATAEGTPWPTNAYQINLRYNMLGGLLKGSQPVIPSELPLLPPNQWHKMRVICQGTLLELYIDDEKCWTFNHIDLLEGYIGIQAEDKKFEFRNIRLRILDPNQ